MKNTIKILAIMIISTGFLFACRGGVNKNNDHDYDGKNENSDGNSTQQIPSDSGFADTSSRYPIDKNPGEEKK